MLIEAEKFMSQKPNLVMRLGLTEDPASHVAVRPKGSASVLTKSGHSRSVQNSPETLDDYATALEAFIAQLRGRAKRVISDGHHDDALRTTAMLASVAEAQIRGANPLRLLLRGFTCTSNKGRVRLNLQLLYLHYRYIKKRSDAKQILIVIKSGFFDRDFYTRHNKDVANTGVDPVLHFLDHGAKELRSPSTRFDVPFYLKRYPDVEVERENPLVHFLRFGMNDGYLPLAPDEILPERHWALPVRPAVAISKPQEIKALPAKVESSKDVTAPRIVVYTAVAGGYDQLAGLTTAYPDVDFVVFRDDAEKVAGWTPRPFNFFHKDPTRMARFVKLHPHLYFSDYDVSVWIDANIIVKGDLRELIQKLADDDVAGIFHHPLRNCVYVEGKECIKRSKDNSDAIERQLEKYKSEGYPVAAGLWETNVVVRRHNDARCKALMKEWWKEIEAGSRRDQLSLPVAAMRAGIEIVPLGRRRENARDHKIVGLVQHPPRKIVANAIAPKHVQRPIDLQSRSTVIGICVHNALEDVKACLNSIVRSNRHEARVVIVDDASNEDTAEFLKGFAQKNPFVKLIRNDDNKGYTNSANVVLAHGGSDWTVVLNSDTILARNSIGRLISAGEQFAHIGVIGAMSNAASWQSVPRLTGDDGKFCVNKVPDGMTVDDVGEICATVGADDVVFVPLVNGFCFAVRKAAADVVGFFDEEHFPMGYGEEDDFCLRATDFGFQCALALSAYVFHAKSATFTAERRVPLVAQGAAALKKKHGEERLKASVQYLRHHPRLLRLRDDFAALESIGTSTVVPDIRGPATRHFAPRQAGQDTSRSLSV